MKKLILMSLIIFTSLVSRAEVLNEALNADEEVASDIDVPLPPPPPPGGSLGCPVKAEVILQLQNIDRFLAFSKSTDARNSINDLIIRLEHCE